MWIAKILRCACYNKTYMAARRLGTLNLKKTCAEYRVGLWQCPQFLFLIMGIIIILSVIVTYVVASRYEEPEAAALIVLFLAGALFVIGNLIVSAFEQVALSARSKSEFISIMSHQLRSPLSAIKWQLNLLLPGGVAKNIDFGTVQKYLQTVYDQNERMIRSVNDLLEVNRIEDNDLILRPADVFLAELTRKVLEEYKNLASASNIEFELRAEDGRPALADEERMRHVIEHLVDNAIRYSPGGGRVLIETKQDDGKILWRITDRGAGIPKSDQGRVFEKFFRSDHALRYQTEGSGVGLFIAKSIIKKSGGEIGFSSSLEKGSIFWFTLPAKV